MKLTVFLAAIAAVPFGASLASGDIVKVINTGFDEGAASKITNLLPDPDYLMGAGTAGGFAGATPVAVEGPIPPTYVPDNASAVSRWLQMPPGIDTVVGGSYFFEIAVDLTGFDATTGQIVDLRYAADNQLLLVEVNNVTLFSQAGGGSSVKEFLAFHDLGDLGLGAFQTGINTIRFEVENDINTGPTAMSFRVEGTVEAAIPEPSTFILAGSGIILMIAAAFRRRRK